MRYLLFAGNRFYPGGGWRDYKMDFPSAESAQNAVNGFLDDYDWWQVVDSQTRIVVGEGRKDLRSGRWEVAGRKLACSSVPEATA